MLNLLILPPGPGLHPMLAHVPVALLLTAPLFILIGAAVRPVRGRPWMWAALLLMSVGTASLFVAAKAGHAGAPLAGQSAETQLLLEQHQRLALETRGVFVMLLTVFCSVLLVPWVLRQRTRLLSTVLPLSFLLLYAAGVVLLLATARAGATLVDRMPTTGYAGTLTAGN